MRLTVGNPALGKQDHNAHAGTTVKCRRYRPARITGGRDQDRQRILDIAFEAGQACREEPGAHVLERDGGAVIKLEQ